MCLTLGQVPVTEKSYVSGVDLLTAVKEVRLILVRLATNYNFRPHLNNFKALNSNKIESFHQPKDKLVCFCSELLQKYYLASFLKIDYKNIKINYTPHGKPYLEKPVQASRNIHYNISHSYDYVLLGIYQGAELELGVDIEYINPEINFQDLQKLIFSESEQALINGSYTNFFKLWTKKEALIKAIGCGFANEYFLATNLNTSDIEVKENYIIITKNIENYFISLALYNKNT